MPWTSRARRSASTRLRRGIAGGALTLCAGLPFAAPAQAASLVVAAGSGMTMPAGVAVTTNGSVWVADRALGICRVQPGAQPGDPAQLVASPYCQPVAGAVGAPPRQGPTTGHQMVFDEGSASFFVAEGDSKGAGVWRLHWDPATDTIDRGERIVSTNGNRVFALAMGQNPDGSVYVDFNGRDDGTIRRLDNAQAATPVGISATPVVGISNTPGLPSMANLDGVLYLAEAGGVTRIAAPGPGAPLAERVAGFPAGTGAVPNALVADSARGRVYAGTANVNGLDRVDVLTPAAGAVATYETGFALVTGLGVRANGTLLVADDPPASAGAPESLGQSRLWDVPLHAADLPTVTITAGAEPYSNARATSFSFSSTPAASFECRLDAAAWAACQDASGPTGSQSYADLADGVHVFEVRGAADGPPARRTFVVDTRPPVATVDDPAPGYAFVGDALRVRFSADEFGVTYACELDGTPVFACDAPQWLRGFEIGRHTFTVTPTDLAGNVGAKVPWTFERLAPPPPPAPAPQDDSGSGSASSGPGSALEQAGASASSLPAAAPCRRLKSAREGSYKLNARGRGRLLTARIAPPAGARYVKLTVRLSGARRVVQRVALRTVSGTKARSLRAILTPAQALRLRTRRAVLTVAYGTCAGTLGASSDLALRSTTKRTAR